MCVCLFHHEPPSSSLLQPFHGPWMRRKHLLFASETNVFHLKATGLEVPPERVTTRRFGCFRTYVAGQVTRIPL
jgi:hypothetical protein